MLKNNSRNIIIVSIILALLAWGIMNTSNKDPRDSISNDTDDNEETEVKTEVEPEREYRAYQKAVMNLNDALDENASSELSQVFGMVYVDPEYNTVHLVVTKTDNASKLLFIEAMKPEEGVTLLFHEGSANHLQLDEWSWVIFGSISRLKWLGKECYGLYINKEGKIEVPLINPSPENVEALFNEIGDRVPREAVVVVQGSPVVAEAPAAESGGPVEAQLATE